MVNKEQIKQWFAQLGDKLNEQAWFQQLKVKWDELDPQSKTVLQTTNIILIVLLVLGWSFSSLWGVHKLKREFADKTELLSILQSSNDELKRLQEKLSGNGSTSGGEGEVQPWTIYLESIASSSGISKDNITIKADRPEIGKDAVKEALIDIELKKVNIKQVVRYAFQLENGTRPVKLRALKINPQSDMTGYLDSTLSVSAFTLKNKEGS